MKKTFSVNIGGRIFNIDEDAYQMLSDYLNAMKKHFDGKVGADEIINDIESRIAEIMQERINTSKQVITLIDVKEIIVQLGQPFEIDEESQPEEKSTNSSNTETHKRLFRDPDNKVIGGVCGGLGAYFKIDPVIIRVIFAVTFLLGGSSLIVYLILWIAIPEARTTVEKLQMSGEPINVDNIEKKIKHEFNELKKKFGSYKTDVHDAVKNMNKNIPPKSNIDKFFSVIGDIIISLARAIGIIIGLVFIFVGIFVLIGFLFSLITSHAIVGFTSMGITSFSITQFLDVIFINNTDKTIAIIGIIIVVAIPLLMLIYNGIKLIFGWRFRVRFLGISIFSFWLAGAILIAIVSLNIVRDFAKKESITENITITQPQSKTLYINLLQDSLVEETELVEETFYTGKWNVINKDGQITFFGIPEISLVKSNDNNFKVLIYKYARGKNIVNAAARAKSIIYNYEQKGDTISINPYYFLPKDDKWRNQSLKIYIYIPTGKDIMLNQSLEKIINIDEVNSELNQYLCKKVTITDNGIRSVNEIEETVIK